VKGNIYPIFTTGEELGPVISVKVLLPSIFQILLNFTSNTYVDTPYNKKLEIVIDVIPGIYAFN